jgi:hypothetical protein
MRLRLLWLAGLLVGLGHAQRTNTHRRILHGMAPPPPYGVHSASLDELLNTTTGTDLMHRPPLPPALTGPFPPGILDESIKPSHMPPVRISVPARVCHHRPNEVGRALAV